MSKRVRSDREVAMDALAWVAELKKALRDALDCERGFVNRDGAHSVTVAILGAGAFRGATEMSDHRRRIEPPCELGHRRQVMECPSCSQRITGKAASAEWWAWYRRRYRKRAVSGEPPE
jgi:hypothetical protein